MRGRKKRKEKKRKEKKRKEKKRKRKLIKKKKKKKYVVKPESTPKDPPQPPSDKLETLYQEDKAHFLGDLLNI